MSMNPSVWLKNARLSVKLSIIFIFVGLLTILSMGLVSYDFAKDALEKKAFAQLVSIREMKASQIEDHFRQIRNQAMTFSENQMIVEAMQSFKTSFPKFSQQNQINENKQKRLDSSLKRYYRNEYLRKLSPNIQKSVSV